MAAMSNRSPSLLPDVAGDAVALARPLDWVGMDHIALPVRIADGQGGQLQVAADIDVAVNLGRAEARLGHDPRGSFERARDLLIACDAQLYLTEVEEALAGLDAPA